MDAVRGIFRTHIPISEKWRRVVEHMDQYKNRNPDEAAAASLSIIEFIRTSHSDDDRPRGKVDPEVWKRALKHLARPSYDEDRTVQRTLDALKQAVNRRGPCVLAEVPTVIRKIKGGKAYDRMERGKGLEHARQMSDILETLQQRAAPESDIASTARYLQEKIQQDIAYIQNKPPRPVGKADGQP